MRSDVQRDRDDLHMQFVEVVYRMSDQGGITTDQRDACIDLLARIDEYSHEEFARAWDEVMMG